VRLQQTDCMGRRPAVVIIAGAAGPKREETRAGHEAPRVHHASGRRGSVAAARAQQAAMPVIGFLSAGP